MEIIKKFFIKLLNIEKFDIEDYKEKYESKEEITYVDLILKEEDKKQASLTERIFNIRY